MFDCKRCGSLVVTLVINQEYCTSCEYERTQPKSYGILSGGNIKNDNPNPFVRRASANTLPSKMLTEGRI